MKDLKVAVTGGIGSGKSEVLKIISSLGYKTVSLDEVYAQLLREKDFVLLISNAFEIDPIISNGNYTLDKKALSNKVFNNKELLNKLNKLTHGAIFEKAFSNHSGVVFYEVPLLFEGGYEYLFDKIIVVSRNINDRIDSAVLRDKATKEEILKKISNQVDYSKLDLSQYEVIENKGGFDKLKKLVSKTIEGVL